MLSLYHKIWVDAITLTKRKNGRSGAWKLLTIIPISAIQGINFFTILLLVRILTNKKTLLLFPLSIFRVGPFNTFLSILITLFVPFVILNYLLIFSYKQYNELLKLYKPKDGKLYLSYCLLSIGLLVVPFIFNLLFLES
jgi:hypothetical protein